MSSTGEVPRSFFQKVLDVVERVGNKVPHPAVLFFFLIVALVLLSHVFHLLDIKVSYERIDPDTHQIVKAETRVNSLLAPDGIRFITTSVVPNFINFGPVGIIIVAMIGIGLSERSGLIQALLRKIVQVAPASTIPAIVVTLGVVSSIASDAGYLVLIPLGAAAFYSLGRHPLAGLAAAFAGVAATFGANFLVKPIDGILVEMTNEAIHIVDPGRSLTITANFYFGIASSLILIVVCTLVTSWIVEPRLGKYKPEQSPDEQPATEGAGSSTAIQASPPAQMMGTPPEEGAGLSVQETKGLWYALGALVGVMIILSLLTIPPGAPLRHPESGAILGDSPFMGSLVYLIMVVFGITGLAYGVGASTIKNSEGAIDAITRTLGDLGGLLFLFFVISQFVAYFNYSNIGTILAVSLANILKDANLNSITLLLAFLLIGFVLCFPLPNIIPKWAIIAPVFIPLFLKLGIEPEVVLAAYRVSDSPPNVINPLLPHFALVVSFARRWQKDAGVGTLVAMMLPFTVATFIAWTLLFFAWYLLRLPFGPG
jgi:aminobenzoyl-glutamate transport protein